MFKPMLVADQSHIYRVRDALWQRLGGGASVMVGSGFSKKAVNIRPDGQDPPIWRDVVERMYQTLYPHESGRALLEGNLRIAQEYDTAFGRTDLHHFIQQTVRDDDFKPGNGHIRLLSLPWRDVFTTNWDTLLERARISVPERSYSVVTNMDQIPRASRPRIVKLHGSLPAQFPLIFTEEDYRTYSIKFAPFVNTVQQSMMETVFCLIGFSGEDPNFLHWSGWVRDNLGDAAPKIYLAGWLGLSHHRRRMLEDRNVVPIDLALHPKAGEWPEHLRHHYAMEWILHTLERGRPNDITRWPRLSERRFSSVPQEIQPVEELVADEPVKGPDSPLPEHDLEQLTASVRETLKTWEHNRKIFPGWLTVPANSRYAVNSDTEAWEQPILTVLPQLSPVERLNAVHEIVWRREVMLEPISPFSLRVETVAEEALSEIDCQARTIGHKSHTEVDWQAVREVWRAVALSLVTAARFRFERETFESRIEALSPFLQDHPDIAQRIHHERCLWAAYCLDFQNLESSLRDWRAEGVDPVWMLRKAALLVEVNRIEEAVQLVNRTLLVIRENPGDGRSVAGASREGWALCLVSAFENGYRLWHADQGQVETPQSFLGWDERRVELAPLKCDAFAEIQRYREDIAGTTDKTKKLPFDLGVSQSEGFTFSKAEYNQWLAAHRAVRLHEVAGLPTANSLILKLAAGKLSASHAELAARLLLRISSYDGDPPLTQVFSRTRVAAMSADLVNLLAQTCESVIEYALPRIASEAFWPIAYVERLRVALEALSRFVLRLGPDSAQSVFNRALTLYGTEAVARHPWLPESLGNLLNRSWETLSEPQRAAHVVELLSAPVVGLNLGIDSGLEHRYPEPAHLLTENSLPTRTAHNEGRWEEIVNLLVRGLGVEGEARNRAARRVASISLRTEELLTDSDSSRIAGALWHQDFTDPARGLPGKVTLHDWVFLLMPEPEPGIAERCFRAKWLVQNRAPEENVPSSDIVLWQVGIAISGLKACQRRLVLSADEKSYLTEVVNQWTDAPVPRHFNRHVQSEMTIHLRLVLHGLPFVLDEIQIPGAVGEKLYEKIQALNNAGIPAFTPVAGLVEVMPDRFDDLALFMRMGLASDNENLTKGAVEGLDHWLRTSAGSTSHIHPPPNDLIREIGVILANRRRACLAPSLCTAKWLMDKGNDAQKETIRDLALQGLGYLAEELRYDKDYDLNDDLPLIRWRSAQLAVSLAEHGSENAPVVVRWLEIAQNDPLPEVRYLPRPAITHESVWS